MSEAAKCSRKGCLRDARMGVRTSRPSAEKLTSTVFYDNRTAPKTALLYCKAHGLDVVRDLVGALVDGDDDA